MTRYAQAMDVGTSSATEGDTQHFRTRCVNLDVISSIRPNRSPLINGAGAPSESLAPVGGRQVEQPPVEATPRVEPLFQDTFEAASEKTRAEFDAAHRRQPAQHNALATQEPQTEAVAGASARSQPAEQAELAPYDLDFWNDSQDFGASSPQGPALTVPEPPRVDGLAETDLADGVQPQAAAAAPETDSLNDRFEDFKASGGAPGGSAGRIPWLDWMVESWKRG